MGMSSKWTLGRCAISLLVPMSVFPPDLPADRFQAGIGPGGRKGAVQLRGRFLLQLPEDGLVTFDREEYGIAVMNRQGGADRLRNGHLAFQGHLGFPPGTISFIIPYFLHVALPRPNVKVRGSKPDNSR